MYLIFYQDYKDISFGMVFGTFDEAVLEYIKDESNGILKLEIGKEAEYDNVSLSELKDIQTRVQSEQLNKYIKDLSQRLETERRDTEYRKVLEEKQRVYEQERKKLLIFREPNSL